MSGKGKKERRDVRKRKRKKIRTRRWRRTASALPILPPISKRRSSTPTRAHAHCCALRGDFYALARTRTDYKVNRNIKINIRNRKVYLSCVTACHITSLAECVAALCMCMLGGMFFRIWAGGYASLCLEVCSLVYARGYTQLWLLCLKVCSSA